MKITEIITSLEATRSSNDKKKIIEENIDNNDLVQTFYLAYNPYINFFIKKLPKVDPNSHTGSITYSEALERLSPIYNKEITGSNARKQYITDLLTECTYEDADVLKRVIAKNLKCGCGRTLFNKVHKIIPKFSVLLAETFEDKTIAELNAPYYVQLKSDGSRACALVYEDKINFYSREGNELLINALAIKKLLTDLRHTIGYDFMIDGELVLFEDGVCDRQRSNGIINKAIVGTITEEEDSKLHYYVWDLVSIENFENGMDSTPYSERLQRLDPLNGLCIPDSSIQVSPTDIVDTVQEITGIINNYLAKGEEGAVIKSHDLVWQDKRTNHMLKAKDIRDCDLIAVSWNPRDENVAMSAGIGSINFESSDGKVKVAVSSGLSYEMCGYVKDPVTGNYVFDNTFDCDKYNGKVGKILYNKLIPNKEGDGYTLFSPRIVVFREDKNEANSLEEIR